jgi:hypothetical protein
MAYFVPYRSNGSARAMMQRAMTTVGTRDAGRPAMLAAPRRTIQPVTRGMGDMCCPDCAPPTVNYQAAKRQQLGALGASPAIGYARQAYSGVGTGAAVASATTAIGTSVAGAIGAGAAAGSVVPIIGTAIGAIVGLLASGILNHKTDPEVANFNQASALYKQSRLSVLNIANKYLVLAGLFDLQPGQIKGNIPIYKKYGRMGEGRFVTDMCNKIYQAAQSGQITASDTPTSIMNRIVQPWIDSFGFGVMSDSNQDMITLIILGMVADYVTGNQRSWFAVGGDYPFGSLTPFALPAPPQLAPPQPVQVQAPPAAQVPIPGTNPAGYGSVQPLCAAPYVWNGSQCVMPTAAPGTVPTAASCQPPYVWNGTQCVIPNNAIPPDPGTVRPLIAPAGWVNVGNDAQGNPIFANPQGVLYSGVSGGWQIFSGQLATGSSSAAQMQAALQNALAQGQSAQQAAAAALYQAQQSGVAVTPQVQQQVAAQVGATQSAAIQPIAAGVGASGMAGWIGAGAAVLGLIFATARPAKGGRRNA